MCPFELQWFTRDDMVALGHAKQLQRVLKCLDEQISYPQLDLSYTFSNQISSRIMYYCIKHNADWSSSNFTAYTLLALFDFAFFDHKTMDKTYIYIYTPPCLELIRIQFEVCSVTKKDTSGQRRDFPCRFQFFLRLLGNYQSGCQSAPSLMF